jgi:hypothetical protein
MARKYARDKNGRFAGGGSTGAVKGLVRRTDGSRSINAGNLTRRPTFKGQLLQRGALTGSAKPKGTISATATGRRKNARDANTRQIMGDKALERGDIAKARQFYKGTGKATAKKLSITAPQRIRSLTGTSKPRGSTISGTARGREAFSSDKPVFKRNSRPVRSPQRRRKGSTAGARYLNS